MLLREVSEFIQNLQKEVEETNDQFPGDAEVLVRDREGKWIKTSGIRENVLDTGDWVVEIELM